jgi:hypothetical protein
MNDQPRRSRAEELITLAWESGPWAAPGTAQFDDWTTYARATVARCAHLFESILVLEKRPLDGEVLARSLFDHVLKFAWIGADPKNHLRRWVADDLNNRKALIDHAHKFGYPQLDADTLKFFAENCDGVKGLPPVSEMAKVADKHWVPKFGDDGLFENKTSLEALYAVQFRGFSASVHPTAQGLGSFGRLTQKGVVLVGRPVLVDPRRQCIDACSEALTVLLLITGKALGWPDLNTVAAVWRRYPASQSTGRGGGDDGKEATQD